ncbi:MAG: triose-phosphate isomerase [Alphaproteobacteria bacterium]|nr:triose-phosphate isomerase [Alphaproteobacteria bacterium]
MTLPRPLIAGNWKMNGHVADGTALARAVVAGSAGLAAELLICPPATLIGLVAREAEGSAVAVGGQDCHAKPGGAFTGDIAAPMLKDLGCRYVIVGHSERRTLHGERDSDVQAKAGAALAAGLAAIVCIGETLAERDSGATLPVIARQLAGSLPAGASAATLVVAYEPVWAIGTGRVASVDQVAEVHALIRRELGARLSDGAMVRILYGGSVKPDNAVSLLGVADVDGALVGGASLDAKAFLAIAAAAPARR